MKFGLVLPTQRDAEEPPVDGWQAVERQAKLAEELGFDSLWVGEHHFMDHPYFDNLQTLSYLAGVTDDVALGTAVCLAPLYNPIRLAERVANLDAQSNGRVILGLGLGYRQKEFDVLGIDRSRRVPRLLETVELLRRCWREDEFTFAGDEFSFDDVSVNPKPVQSSGPPLWLGGKAPAAVRRAARLGDAWLPAPSYTLDELERCYGVYDRNVERESSSRPVWRDVFVHPDHDRAVSLAKGPLQKKYDRNVDWGSGAADSPSGSEDDGFESYSEGRFLIGTPEEVTADLTTYRERFGVDHLIVRSQWPGMSDGVAEDSIRLFTDEVAPEFS